MMKNQLFSKKTRHMLEDNGYSLKQNESTYTFKHTSSTALGVIVVAAFVALFNVIFIIINPIAGSIAFLMLIVATTTVTKKMKGKILLEINTEEKRFKIHSRSFTSNWASIDSINEMSLRSKYVDEYTSAFKNTSEEHQITIELNINGHGVVQVFKFSADYAEPSKEINEVYAFLEDVLNSNKPEVRIAS